MTLFSSLLLSLFLSAALTFAAFKLSKVENKKLNVILSVLRGIFFFLLIFMIIVPLMKWDSGVIQKPIIFLAQDKSESIKHFNPEGFDLKEWGKSYRGFYEKLKEDYEVINIDFDRTSVISDSLSFDYQGKQTNMSAMVQYLSQNFIGENIGALVIFSDGVINAGGNPLWQLSNLTFPVYTVALGDTTQRTDISIKNILHNKIVYHENDFVVEVNIEASKFKGLTTLIVEKDKKTLFKKELDIDAQHHKEAVQVVLSADKKGLQKYSFRLETKQREFTKSNNFKDIFIDVLESQVKILLAYVSPHPDISAIKQSLSSLKKYKVDALQMDESIDVSSLNEYDVLVLHQIPNKEKPSNKLFEYIKSSNISTLFVVGQHTDLAVLNKHQNIFQFISSAGLIDIQPILNKEFAKFVLSDSTKNKVAALPPLLSPFAHYKVKKNDVLFYQKVENIFTENPLISFDLGGLRNQAIIFGEGLWRWQMYDFLHHNNHQLTKEILSKIIQLLTVKEGKKRFVVNLPKKIFSEQESIFMSAELYNDSYESINSPDISIEIKNEKGNSFPFRFSRGEQTYYAHIGAFPVGEYTYQARTTLGGQTYTANGQFVVSPLNLELIRSHSNHRLLSSISYETGGKLFYPHQLNEAMTAIKNNSSVAPVYVEKPDFLESIEWHWLLPILIGLMGLEWFLRKYYGEV